MPPSPKTKRTGVEPRPIVEIARNSPMVVKSAARVLEIFEFFDEIRRAARVNEIVDRLGYPQSSTSALLKSLVDIAYMNYDPRERTYFPSFRISLLGSWVAGEAIATNRLMKLMEAINVRTGETVVLATRNGQYAQYINVLQAINPIRFHIPVGARRLLVRSAGGTILLLDVPEREIRLLVSRANAEMEQGRPLVQPREVMHEISLAREQGYSISRGRVTPGGGQIAMKLPPNIDPQGRQLAIGVSAVLQNLERNEHEIVAIMREELAKISDG